MTDFRFTARISKGRWLWRAECEYQPLGVGYHFEGRPVVFWGRTRSRVVAKSERWASRQRNYRLRVSSETVEL